MGLTDFNDPDAVTRDVGALVPASMRAATATR
jgi:hypothetical protein